MHLRDGDVITRRDSDDVRQWRKRRNRMPLKQTMVLIAFISAPFFFIGGLLYVLLFSPYFIIEFVDIKVSGGLDAGLVRTAVFQQMDTKLFGFISQKRIYFFDIDAVEQSIRKTSAIDEITIRKKFPNTLKIEVEGKPFKLVFFSAGHFYEVALDGSILREIEGGLLESIPQDIREVARLGVVRKEKNGKKGVEQGTRKIVPIIIDEEQKSVEKGEVVFDANTLVFLSGIQDKLQESGVTTVVLKKKRGSLDLRALTSEGWEILLTLLENDVSQVRNLETVLREKIKDDRKRLKYVDVRFSNRIYYSLR